MNRLNRTLHILNSLTRPAHTLPRRAFAMSTLPLGDHPPADTAAAAAAVRVLALSSGPRLLGLVLQLQSRLRRHVLQELNKTEAAVAPGCC